MKWETVKLGDVTDSCLGKMLDQNKNKGTPQPYLANVNVRWGSFDLDNLSEMRFEEHEQERYGLRYGDLVVCEGGEPGRCAIWKDEIPNMKIQKALHRVRVHEDMDYRYLFYWFLHAGERGALDQYFTGATIKHMPGDKLKTIEIEKPPLSVQKRIADILSTYDNLIENNQKQIKLLEETARRLYKEWFIDLRFPGYETTSVYDGVPDGWERKAFSAVFSYVRGRSYSSKELSDDGILMANLKNIRAFGGYNRGAEKRYIGDYKESQLLSAGDIIMGVTDMTQERRLVGHVAVVPDVKEPMIFSMDLIKLIPITCPKSYLYSALQFGGLSGRISPLANGVNVLHLKPEAMMNLNMVVPDETTMLKYDEAFSAYQSRIEILQNQSAVAEEARDRLLPKLMSGEMEV